MASDYITEYCKNNPGLEIQDVFKFLFQSCFGCEHLVSDYQSSLTRILEEKKKADLDNLPDIELLGNEFCRIHLKYLRKGLSPETLCRLFIQSSAESPEGSEKLRTALDDLILSASAGTIPFDAEEIKRESEKWENDGFPSLHHSNHFTELHHPSYRVVSREYLNILSLLNETDKLLGTDRKNIVLAIDGRCASGKTTIAGELSKIYDCNVFHIDDFFLRPGQRTAERLSTPGENVDHERFLSEVLAPISEGKEVRYRKFNCHNQCLEPAVTVPFKRLNIIEGSYSLHPSLSGFVDFSVFCNITPELQKERIIRRNGPKTAEKFFSLWIPLEEKYFNAFSIREKADLVICAQ